MAKNKFYAVARGRKPGIYTQWDCIHGAESQVKGFSGAKFKSFKHLDEAKDWFERNKEDESSMKITPS